MENSLLHLSSWIARSCRQATNENYNIFQIGLWNENSVPLREMIAAWFWLFIVAVIMMFMAFTMKQK